ncbi:hypothetical protein [Clostridium tyrobutyricum]|uniref:hypothetical protein n=1 Tax=Clostridium tyrobutyricum TaxID=1519 RepID=UPI0020CE1D0B|nr:hypothetical protein [Clostridium tyrobutyricum]
MNKISDETIKETVDQMFVEKILLFNEIDIMRATSGLPKEGLRVLTFTDYLILRWIRKIVDRKQELATPETKIKIIKEIFNCMDKYMNED